VAAPIPHPFSGADGCSTVSREYASHLLLFVHTLLPLQFDNVLVFHQLPFMLLSSPFVPLSLYHTPATQGALGPGFCAINGAGPIHFPRSRSGGEPHRWTNVNDPFVHIAEILLHEAGPSDFASDVWVLAADRDAGLFACEISSLLK